MEVSFPVRDNVRGELEAAPSPFSGWWRARVVGGKYWLVNRPLPWSYGVTEETAFDAALTLWATAGRPGLTVGMPEDHTDEYDWLLDTVAQTGAQPEPEGTD
jgi:hypothetical protein